MNKYSLLPFNKSLFIIIITRLIGTIFLFNTAFAEDVNDTAVIENWRQASVTETGNETMNPCLLLSPKVMINDGQGKTHIWLEMTKTALVLKTKSDIDTAFNDIGIQVDDKDFIPLDRVDNAVDVIFEKNITTITQQFIHGQGVNLQLRFWPTWPSKGVQTAKFSLLGFTKAYKNLAEQCKFTDSELKLKKTEQDINTKDEKDTKDLNSKSATES